MTIDVSAYVIDADLRCQEVGGILDRRRRFV